MTPLSRRRWLQAGTSMLGLGLTGRSASGQALRAPQNFRVLSAPVVQGLSSTAVSIAWAVNDTSTGWVEYGPTEALGTTAAPDDEGLRPLDGAVHRVRLEGLTPGTRYYYRTVSVPIAFLGPYDIRRGRPFQSRTFSFVTPDAGAGARVSCVVINDTHEKKETLAPLLAAIDAQPGDLLFWNGDVFDDIGSEAQLAEQLLYPAGAAYATSRPVYFSRGNHDVRGTEARALGRVLDTPAGHFYYSFRQGPVAFIVLDTGEDKPDDSPEYGGLGSFDPYRTRQARWLVDELRMPHVRDAAFRIVIAHIPLYSESAQQAHGGADARAKWHDALVRGGVDLLVTGHTHRPAWLPADGQRPFGQLTGGGPRPEQATIIRLEADRDRLRARMHRLDESLITEQVIARRS